MKDLGGYHHFLGMHINRDYKHAIFKIFQEEYIYKVFQCFNMQGGEPVSTPMDEYLKLGKNDCSKFDVKKVEMAKVPYLLIVGSLMCAMVSTRLDITYAMGVVSRYMANPTKRHWEVANHIL